MPSVSDILKKVRELEIRSRKLTHKLFAGEYHSAFKGRGMTFKEVREYYHGDDPRFIDWNVSARFGHPYSKLFEAERDLSVILLVDVSASSFFGTKIATKRDLITEIAAVLCFAASKHTDKVGVIFFSDKIEYFIPPKKGNEHALFIVRQLLTLKPTGKGTDLQQALRFFLGAVKHKSVAFILSDFNTDGYEDVLRVAGNKHDLIGINIFDKMDMELPHIGLLKVEDLETNQQKWIDTEDPYVQHQYTHQFNERTLQCSECFKRSGAELLYIRTDEDYVQLLQQFFMKRY